MALNIGLIILCVLGLNRLKGWILYYIFDLTEARNKRMPKDNSESALMARMTVNIVSLNVLMGISY